MCCSSVLRRLIRSQRWWIQFPLWQHWESPALRSIRGTSVVEVVYSGCMLQPYILVSDAPHKCGLGGVQWRSMLGVSACMLIWCSITPRSRFHLSAQASLADAWSREEEIQNMDMLLMHVKCIHDLCTLPLDIPHYLHHILVIFILFDDYWE
jgi:hypothetical protein